MPLTFRKAERLSGRNSISRLLKEGDGFFIYPYRVYVLSRPKEPGLPVLRVAMAVPKKNFRQASTRNGIKRHMREAYRISPVRSRILENHTGEAWDVLFILAAKEIPDFTDHQKAMNRVLQKVVPGSEPGNA